MKIGAGLAVIALGAILAFAVTANTSVFNIHTAGYVLILVGIAYIVFGRRASNWVGGRTLVRRVRSWPGGRLQEQTIPPYVTRNPGDSRVRAGLTQALSVRSDKEAAKDGDVTADDLLPGDTEVIEDVYEQ
jgi:hypothetical protein